MKNLEELIYNKLSEKAKKPNPKDHTTLSFEDMQAAVQKAQSAKKVADDKKLAKNIPGDEYRKLPTVSDKFQIIVPMSTRASCLYGAGTKWCTAASEDNQFNRYYNRWGMTLYYVLPKKVNPDFDMISPEEAAADEEEFAHFFTEGKVQDLQKKYPEWDISAFKDPSGKNKYLDWMVKTAVNMMPEVADAFQSQERRREYATGRVNNVIDYYHKLLPYIGREEKPEKKKEKGQRQERTRFDKVAIVMHPEGYRSKMYDAQDKDIELKELISFIMPTWGIDAKEGLDVFGAVEDAIIDDMAENPNPVRDRMNKIKGAVDSLNDALESNYHDNLKPNFFDDPEKASRAPVAYGTLKNYRVEPGEMVIPFTANFYFPIPDEIGGYEKITKDRTFRGNDRGRLQNFKDMLRNNMQLWRPAATMVNETFKSFDAAKEKYTKKLQNEFGESQGKSKADTIFQRRPKDDKHLPAPEADIEYVGPVTKQRFIFMDLRMMVKIRDTVGAIDEGGLDETMLNVVGDIRNFMEDGIQKVKEQAWEEFQFMAKRWMEQNPRKSPEEEKAETEKRVEDIMAHLPEERQTMSLEEKILAKLMGEEEILLEVDYEQAQASLTGKPAQKLVKSFNFDKGKEPTDDMSRLVTTIRNTIMTTVPHDVLPGEVANDPSMDPIGREKEIEKRRALGIMWMLRLLKKDKELTARLLGNKVDGIFNTSREIKQDMEKFFQHNRHMKVKDLNQIQTADDLNKVVTQAQKSIDAENEKKMGSDAGQGTEFFAGAFKKDADGNIMRDEEGIPQFRRSKDGWVIAAAHNRGAACLLGKKTSWCTASPGLNYFEQYYGGEDDPLFYLHKPGGNVDSADDGDRFQFHYGSKQFMDVEDTPVRGAEFEELHEKLKDTLSDAGLEDRFSEVFEFQMTDYEQKVADLVEETRGRIDNPRISIQGSADDDWDNTAINGYFEVDFEYDRGDFEGEDDLAPDGYDLVGDMFNKGTDGQIGWGHTYHDDMGEGRSEEHVHISVPAGGRRVAVRVDGSFYGTDEHGLDGLENYFHYVIYNIEGAYEDIKAKIRMVLIEEGVLPMTKYDKLLYGGDIRTWDDEEEDEKTAEEYQEDFEEQFKNVNSITFDPDNAEIDFHIYGPAPAEIANKSKSLKNMQPKDKQLPFRRALLTMSQVAKRQPALPGFEDDADEAVDALNYLASRSDLVSRLLVSTATRTGLALQLTTALSELSEEEMDVFTRGMKAIDRNYKLFQISLRDAVKRYMDKHPDEVEDLGGPDRPELAEIVSDEVAKAMNEIEPYQKKAKKLQKKAMQLTIKGPNKYMTKGMKIATAKPGKSAPPGG